MKLHLGKSKWRHRERFPYNHYPVQNVRQLKLETGGQGGMLESELNWVYTVQYVWLFTFYDSLQWVYTRETREWWPCWLLKPETQFKRQVTRRRLPFQPAGWWEHWTGEEKIFCTGATRGAKAGQKMLYLHEEPNEPTKERPLSYVILESPFASVL
jgi:hypothetical protein